MNLCLLFFYSQNCSARAIQLHCIGKLLVNGIAQLKILWIKEICAKLSWKLDLASWTVASHPDVLCTRRPNRSENQTSAEFKFFSFLPPQSAEKVQQHPAPVLWVAQRQQMATGRGRSAFRFLINTFVEAPSSALTGSYQLHTALKGKLLVFTPFTIHHFPFVFIFCLFSDILERIRDLCWLLHLWQELQSSIVEGVLWWRALEQTENQLRQNSFQNH